VHQKLHEKFSLKLEHFRRWVEIFGATVDKLFTGETAKNAKLRAKIISYSLNQRTNQDSTQINSKTSN
jgi:hemoglobin